MGIAITAGSAAFAASLKTLNGELAESYKKEATARRNRADERAGGDHGQERGDRGHGTPRPMAREKEKQAREKAEALVARGVRPEPKRAGGPTRAQRPARTRGSLSIPGTQGVREELINTTLTGLEATIASLEQLGTVARDKEGFALGHPDARRDQPARRADRDGIRQVRRDGPLLPPHGGTRRATGRGRPRRARTAEGQGQRQGDSRRLPDGPDRRRRGRPEVLRPGARPPSPVAGPRAVQRRGEARRREYPRRHRPRPLETGRPGQGPRHCIARRSSFATSSRRPSPIRSRSAANAPGFATSSAT